MTEGTCDSGCIGTDNITTGSGKKHLHLLGVNVCGLKSNLRYRVLENYITNFDFICVSETKVNPSVDTMHMPGYKLYNQSMFNISIYGIGILVKDELLNLLS